MKEIGKLIELLNEYEKGDVWSYDEEMGMPYYGWGDDCDYDTYLISKKYGFIKWLVENDKIDFDGIQNVFYRNKRYKEYRDYSDYESLLMLLAISDTPIEDLISYLK